FGWNWLDLRRFQFNGFLCFRYFFCNLLIHFSLFRFGDSFLDLFGFGDHFSLNWCWHFSWFVFGWNWLDLRIFQFNGFLCLRYFFCNLLFYFTLFWFGASFLVLFGFRNHFSLSCPSRPTSYLFGWNWLDLRRFQFNGFLCFRYFFCNLLIH